MRRVYITGASGAGVSTLGKALAATLHVPQADIDDYYWLPTEIPFSKRRRVTDRVRLLKSALGAKGWVLSGSFDSWADPLLDGLDLVVFVSAPTAIRLARLRAREKARFGDRIEPGGDMAAIHAGFMAWASRYDDPDFSGRNRARHEEWLDSSRHPVLRLSGTQPTAAQVKAVLNHPALAKTYA
ncbi:adenylate kinase [Thalassovita sp.]|uniref:adenylate kinase n=1 Tax=Thalassovita sp. TaxID=1979401 RepID=UPI002B27254A|nr:adenylate kinase [Thalassovita sp.]